MGFIEEGGSKRERDFFASVNFVKCESNESRLYAVIKYITFRALIADYNVISFIFQFSPSKANKAFVTDATDNISFNFPRKLGLLERIEAA